MRHAAGDVGTRDKSAWVEGEGVDCDAGTDGVGGGMRLGGVVDVVTGRSDGDGYDGYGLCEALLASDKARSRGAEEVARVVGQCPDEYAEEPISSQQIKSASLAEKFFVQHIAASSRQDRQVVWKLMAHGQGSRAWPRGKGERTGPSWP